MAVYMELRRDELADCGKVPFGAEDSLHAKAKFIARTTYGLKAVPSSKPQPDEVPSGSFPAVHDFFVRI
jgi:hypothetical protein